MGEIPVRQTFVEISRAEHRFDLFEIPLRQQASNAWMEGEDFESILPSCFSFLLLFVLCMFAMGIFASASLAFVRHSNTLPTWMDFLPFRPSCVCGLAHRHGNDTLFSFDAALVIYAALLCCALGSLAARAAT